MGVVLQELDRDWENGLLGIPTIEDRVAQMVLRDRLESMLKPMFYEDTYGYKPNK